tara:strand:+ start:2647 stop:3342 length:696 start_codon:yes stop_codon:yes gene_type:complete
MEDIDFDNMSFADLPLVIDMTLYKNNYYDNIIISQLKRNSRFIRFPGNSGFVVSANEFKDILTSRFPEQLKQITPNPTSYELKKGATSIFFINDLLTNLKNLKFVKISVSNEKEYSRRVKMDDDSKNDAIVFDFKVIHSVIDFTKYIKGSKFKILNDFLLKSKIINKELFRNGPPFIQVKSTELMDKIAIFEDTYSSKDKYQFIVDIFFTLVDAKIEEDNCDILIITDYPE